jgi:hypothetical protein
MAQSPRLFDYHLRRVEARLANEREAEYGGWQPRWTSATKAKVRISCTHARSGVRVCPSMCVYVYIYTLITQAHTTAYV